MLFKQAFLNLLRHRTRMLLSLLTISGAISAIVLFRGYAADIIESLKEFGVSNQFGHVQVANSKLWDPESQRLKDRLFVYDGRLENLIRDSAGFVSVGPRLSLEGLLNLNESQFAARVIGYEPNIETDIFQGIRIPEGEPFKTGDEREILLGIGLQRRLRAKVGDSVTVITQTVDGVVSALDLKVRGVFATTVSEIDEATAYVPLQLAQRILETKQIESLLVRIEDMDSAETFRDRLAIEMKSQFPNLRVRAWRELANLYNQVEEFYTVQNLVIQVILGILTVLAVMNTVGMTVYERTGEVGTLRALGLKQNEVLHQFLVESSILSFIAACVGSLIGAVMILTLNSAGFTTNLPGASVPIPVKALFQFSAFVWGIMFGTVATFFGTLLPAYKASRMSVVASLRRNI